MDNNSYTEPLEPKQVNQLAESNTTSDDVYRRRKKEQKEAQIEGWLEIAKLGGSVYGLATIVNNDPTLSFMLSKIPGADRYKEKHDIARRHALGGNFDPVNLTEHYKDQSFGRSALSIVSSIEELSPFHILKTLQVSNIIEPFVSVSRKPKDIKITGSALNSSITYYDSLITELSNGKHKLHTNDLNNGLVLRNNKLYRYFEDGKTLDLENPILNYAKAISTHTKLGESMSPNRVAMRFVNGFNSNLGMSSFNKEQIAVVGGKSRTDFIRRWGDAITRQSLEIGYKTLDNPLGGIEELVKASGANYSGFFEGKTYNSFKKMLNIQLGTGGRYNLSTPESLKLVAKNLGGKSLMAYVGYQAVNQVLDKITPNNSAWNDGIVSGLTTNYANTRVGLAHVIADPFQRYKEAQENAADGSTNLSTLIGLPLVGAVGLGSLPYYKRLYQSKTQGIEKASSIADEAIHSMGFTQKMTENLEKMGIGKVTQSKSLAFKGGLIGAALALPFLPGALVTQSSDELKKRYSGEQLDENRANAYWMAGGNSWEGDQIKNFRPSRVARLLADNKKEVLYDGSNKEQRDLDPIYSPIRYLFNPYKFEEKHKDDMPYPVWGMNVDYGSFLGKIYQGTVGEIIKPTVVNEQFLQDSKALSETPVESFRGKGTNVPNNKTSLLGSIIGSSEGDSDSQLSLGRLVTKPTIINNDDGGYATTYEPRSKDKQLIESGNMLPEESPSVDSASLALSQTYNSFTDFTGLKGFTTSLTISKLGYDPQEIRRQLSRSGESRSLSKDIIDENMGDMLGLGEFQRRVIPTSSDSRIDEINPMHNTVAPSWLPRDESKFYLDFSKGDYWNKVSNGFDRLPGKGFEKFNPELKGMNPEDYPLVYQYKVLSDVATGSPEQISLREKLVEDGKKGKLTEREQDIFYQTLTEEQAKSKKKQFSEYKTPEEFSKLSLTGKGLNILWDNITHNSESPLETLTPFRPGAKFIHKRTAIEDYEKTMIDGPDTAIWTNPYSHFIKPTINRIANIVSNKPYIPEEVEERNNVDEYFDKLGYLKARQSNKFNDSLRTIEGSVASGILDKDSMNKFKSSLSDKEKVYVDSFAQARTDKDRKRILEMTPSNLGEAYKQIWTNLDVAEEAKKHGKDVSTAVKENFVKENTNTLSRIKNIAPSDYIQAIENIQNTNRPDTSELDKQVSEVQTAKRIEADKESENYIESKTGLPDKNWIGWDSRLTKDDLKLRTLRIGKADTYDYGYWKSDVQRNDRITGLDGEKDITTKYNEIKQSLRSDIYKKKAVEDSLFANGFFAKRINLSEATRDDIDIRVDNNNG